MTVASHVTALLVAVSLDWKAEDRVEGVALNVEGGHAHRSCYSYTMIVLSSGTSLFQLSRRLSAWVVSLSMFLPVRGCRPGAAFFVDVEGQQRTAVQLMLRNEVRYLQVGICQSTSQHLLESRSLAVGLHCQARLCHSTRLHCRKQLHDALVEEQMAGFSWTALLWAGISGKFCPLEDCCTVSKEHCRQSTSLVPRRLVA